MASQEFEVIFKPNFNSANCYEVLGCTDGADPTDVEKAYRDLSRKYHPDGNNEDENAPEIFAKIGDAYSTLCQTGADAEEGEDKDKPKTPLSTEEAKIKFEKKYGKYHDMYYNEGAIIGLPYPYDLHERLEMSKQLRESLTIRIGRVRVGVMHTSLIKKQLDLSLLILEMALTATVVTTCILCFLLEETSVIDLVGGISLLLALFILQFWYGFSRYPTMWDPVYFSWIGGVSVDSDLEEIRDWCAYYFHNDFRQTSQTYAALTCLPVTAVDHILAGIVTIILYPISFVLSVKAKKDQEKEDGNSSAQGWGVLFMQQLSKSLGVLLSIVGYYMVWLFGGNIGKAVITAALLVNQSLYTTILFRKSYGEFLEGIFFGGLLSFSLAAASNKSLETTTDVEDEEQPSVDHNHDNNTDHNDDNNTDNNTDNITDNITDNNTDNNTDHITDDNTDNNTDHNTVSTPKRALSISWIPHLRGGSKEDEPLVTNPNTDLNADPIDHENQSGSLFDFGSGDENDDDGSEQDVEKGSAHVSNDNLSNRVDVGEPYMDSKVSVYKAIKRRIESDFFARRNGGIATEPADCDDSLLAGTNSSCSTKKTGPNLLHTNSRLQEDDSTLDTRSTATALAGVTTKKRPLYSSSQKQFSMSEMEDDSVVDVLKYEGSMLFDEKDDENEEEIPASPSKSSPSAKEGKGKKLLGDPLQLDEEDDHTIIFEVPSTSSPSSKQRKGKKLRGGSVQFDEKEEHTIISEVPSKSSSPSAKERIGKKLRKVFSKSGKDSKDAQSQFSDQVTVSIVRPSLEASRQAHNVENNRSRSTPVQQYAIKPSKTSDADETILRICKTESSGGETTASSSIFQTWDLSSLHRFSETFSFGGGVKKHPLRPQQWEEDDHRRKRSDNETFRRGRSLSSSSTSSSDSEGCHSFPTHVSRFSRSRTLEDEDVTLPDSLAALEEAIENGLDAIDCMRPRSMNTEESMITYESHRGSHRGRHSQVRRKNERERRERERDRDKHVQFLDETRDRRRLQSSNDFVF